MISSLKAKIFFSILIFLSLFLGRNMATISLLLGSYFLISELIQRKLETIGIVFILMYAYVGINPFLDQAFQYIESLTPDGDGRGVYIFALPKYIFTVNLGVLDLSFPFVAGLFFFAYFLYTLFNNPHLFKGLPKIIIILFFLAFIPTIIGFIIATAKGINGSLVALRCLFGLSVFFYGYTFSRLKPAVILRNIFLLKRHYIFWLAFLLIIGLMYNHILFIYLGAAASIAVYIWMFEKKIVEALFLIFSVFMGSVNSTFTIMLIPIVSGLLTYLSFTFFNKKIINWLPIIGFMVYLFFLGFILSIPKQQIRLKDESTTEGRLYNKIYGDRFFVWTSYLEEIKKANPFFVIPKESITLYTVFGDKKDIKFGAHNSLIQMLYYFGIIPGTILFIILFYWIKQMLIQSLYLPKFIHALAVGLFSTFIVFGLTGHSIITHAASLFFWLFVGLITGLGVHFRASYKTDTQKNINNQELLGYDTKSKEIYSTTY